MNERIRELTAQVEKYISTTNFEGMPEDEMTYDEIFQKKFAELIVRECQHRVEQYINECGEIASMPKSVIMKHFGVEE
jgi:hypothetical protein